VETTQEYYLDKGKAGARMNSPDAEEDRLFALDDAF
jgi:hypothetical protein